MDKEICSVWGKEYWDRGGFDGEEKLTVELNNRSVIMGYQGRENNNRVRIKVKIIEFDVMLFILTWVLDSVSAEGRGGKG